MANSDGRGAEAIHEQPGGEVASPDWSPDGERIVFASTVSSGELFDFDIYSINADGGVASALTEEIDDPDGVVIGFHSTPGAE